MDSIKGCYISLDRHMSPLYTYVISIKDRMEVEKRIYN